MKRRINEYVNSAILQRNGRTEDFAKAMEELDELGVLVDGVIEYDDDDIELGKKICEILDQIGMG